MKSFEFGPEFDTESIVRVRNAKQNSSVTSNKMVSLVAENSPAAPHGSRTKQLSTGSQILNNFKSEEIVGISSRIVHDNIESSPNESRRAGTRGRRSKQLSCGNIFSSILILEDEYTRQDEPTRVDSTSARGTNTHLPRSSLPLEIVISHNENSIHEKKNKKTCRTPPTTTNEKKHHYKYTKFDESKDPARTGKHKSNSASKLIKKLKSFLKAQKKTIHSSSPQIPQKIWHGTPTTSRTNIAAHFSASSPSISSSPLSQATWHGHAGYSRHLRHLDKHNDSRKVLEQGHQESQETSTLNSSFNTSPPTSSNDVLNNSQHNLSKDETMKTNMHHDNTSNFTLDKGAKNMGAKRLIKSLSWHGRSHKSSKGDSFFKHDTVTSADIDSTDSNVVAINNVSTDTTANVQSTNEYMQVFGDSFHEHDAETLCLEFLPSPHAKSRETPLLDADEYDSTSELDFTHNNFHKLVNTHMFEGNDWHQLESSMKTSHDSFVVDHSIICDCAAQNSTSHPCDINILNKLSHDIEQSDHDTIDCTDQEVDLTFVEELISVWTEHETSQSEATKIEHSNCAESLGNALQGHSLFEEIIDSYNSSTKCIEKHENDDNSNVTNPVTDVHDEIVSAESNSHWATQDNTKNINNMNNNTFESFAVKTHVASMEHKIFGLDERMSDIMTTNRGGALRNFSLSNLYVLVLHTAQRKFEVIQITSRLETDSVADIVCLIPKHCQMPLLRGQKYIGLCRPPSNNNKPRIGRLSILGLNINHDGIFVAVPEDSSIQKCMSLSESLLSNPQILCLLTRRHTNELTAHDIAPISEVEETD